jgi:hypothetical protein
VLFTLLLSGCASVPEPGAGGYPSLIYREGSVLFILNVEEHRELSETVLSRVMDEETVDRFLKRTRRLYVRLYQENDAPPRFDVIAEGSYPRRIAGFAMSREGWEKRKEPSVWWQSPENLLQVAFPTSGLAAVTQENMEGLLSKIHEPVGGGSLPQEVSAVAETAAMYIYGRSPRFSSYFDRRLGILLSKVEDFRMGFFPAAEEGIGRAVASGAGTGPAAGAGEGHTRDVSKGAVYRIEGEYRFRDEATARSFLLTLRLALLRRARSEGKEAVMRLVEERYVTREETKVRISGARIATDELYLLFGVFTPQL